jgi:hypothetical protein
VLIEGGGAWTAKTATQFREAGGRRILFVCGTPGCRRSGARAAERLTDAGVDTKLVWVPSAGHDYPPQMAAQIAPLLPWLVGDDPAWNLQP